MLGSIISPAGEDSKVKRRPCRTAGKPRTPQTTARYFLTLVDCPLFSVLVWRDNFALMFRKALLGYTGVEGNHCPGDKSDESGTRNDAAPVCV